MKTPGPWTVEEAAAILAELDIDADKADAWEYWHQRAINAEAEAYELRKLLRLVLAEFDARYYTPTEPRGLLAQDIRAALAKAEGGS